MNNSCRFSEDMWAGCGVLFEGKFFFLQDLVKNTAVARYICLFFWRVNEFLFY
jgi:hypothetical protein